MANSRDIVQAVAADLKDAANALPPAQARRRSKGLEAVTNKPAELRRCHRRADKLSISHCCGALHVRQPRSFISPPPGSMMIQDVFRRTHDAHYEVN
jgi:hypothetical protein